MFFCYFWRVKIWLELNWNLKTLLRLFTSAFQNLDAALTIRVFLCLITKQNRIDDL